MAKLLTDEQEQFVRENVDHRGNQELADLVNKKFSTNFTRLQIKGWKRNHHLSSGLTGRFEKNHIPANKGKHNPTVGRTAETQFKKGVRSHNYVPIGTVVKKGDRYLWKKIRDDLPSRYCWKQVHRIIWEQANGPIPENMRLIFLDGNRENVALDNLALVTPAEALVLNRKHLIKKNSQLSRIGISVAKLHVKQSELRRRK